MVPCSCILVLWSELKGTAETDLDSGPPPSVFLFPAILSRDPHGLQIPEDFRPAVQRFADRLPVPVAHELPEDRKRLRLGECPCRARCPHGGWRVRYWKANSEKGGHVREREEPFEILRERPNRVVRS